MGCTASKDAVADPKAPGTVGVNGRTVILSDHVTFITSIGEFKKSGNSTTIQPYPGYVIKTKSLASDEKLFVNVFHHYMVDEDGNYPVKDRITVIDKKGEQCIAYGVVIPTVLFDRGEENIQSKEEVSAKHFSLCFSLSLSLLLLLISYLIIIDCEKDYAIITYIISNY